MWLDIAFSEWYLHTYKKHDAYSKLTDDEINQYLKSTNYPKEISNLVSLVEEYFKCCNMAWKEFCNKPISYEILSEGQI